MSSKKEESVYTILVEINKKLDRLVNLATILTDTMNEEMYMRSREASPMIFDPKEYD